MRFSPRTGSSLLNSGQSLSLQNIYEANDCLCFRDYRYRQKPTSGAKQANLGGVRQVHLTHSYS